MLKHINQSKTAQIEFLNSAAKNGRSVLGAFEHLGNPDPKADGYYRALAETFGVSPAMYSTYYPYDRAALRFNYGEANRRVEAHFKEGALCMVHSQNSWGRFLIEDFKDEEDPVDFLRNFDAENPDRNMKVYERYLLHQKNWGDALEDLKNRGVTVFYRPFVEMTNRHHPECYTRTESGFYHFKNIWRQHYDYMVNERGLDNIIWCFAPQAPGGASYGLNYYPGNDYVDVIGFTLYSQGNSNGERSIARELELWDFSGYFELGKPVGFSELGVNEGGATEEPGDFANLLYYLKKGFKGKVSFCCIWSVEQGLLCEKNLHAEEFINDDYFIGLEELRSADSSDLQTDA
ncbi:MAG: glycoside hydrolase family 26 protein [Acutalibacteraceae bacterium]